MGDMGFESSFLVSWEEWDELDLMAIQFYNCKVRSDVFEKFGVDCSIVYTVTFIFDENMLELYDDDTGIPAFKFNLKMDIEEVE